MRTVLCMGSFPPYETELTFGITRCGTSLGLSCGCCHMGNANQIHLHMALDAKLVTKRSRDCAESILVRLVATAVIMSRF